MNMIKPPESTLSPITQLDPQAAIWALEAWDDMATRRIRRTPGEHNKRMGHLSGVLQTGWAVALSGEASDDWASPHGGGATESMRPCESKQLRQIPT